MVENQFPAQYGWICPRCGKVLAPWMSECNCQKIKNETTTEKEIQTIEKNTGKDWLGSINGNKVG